MAVSDGVAIIVPLSSVAIGIAATDAWCRLWLPCSRNRRAGNNSLVPFGPQATSTLSLESHRIQILATLRPNNLQAIEESLQWPFENYLMQSWWRHRRRFDALPMHFFLPMDHPVFGTDAEMLKSRTWADLATQLGISEADLPERLIPPSDNHQTKYPEFNHEDRSVYNASATPLQTTLDILSINRKLYDLLLPEPVSVNTNFFEREACLGVVARGLAGSSPYIVSCIPHRLHFSYSSGQNYNVLLIALADGEQVLVPVCMAVDGPDVEGHVEVAKRKQSIHAGWDATFQSNNRARHGLGAAAQAARNKFSQFPLLLVRDVHYVSPPTRSKPASPAIRSCSDIWTVHEDTSSFSMSRTLSDTHKTKGTRTWSHYRSLEVLAHRLLSDGARVSFSNGPSSRPFSLIALESFTLSAPNPAKYANFVSQTYAYELLDAGYNALTSQLAVEAVSTSNHGAPQCFVDEQPSCSIAECRQPNFPGLLFCVHHIPTLMMHLKPWTDEHDPIIGTRHAPTTPLDVQAVSFTYPRLPKYQRQLAHLRDLYTETPKRLLIFDMEFIAAMATTSPILIEVGVHDGSGQVILNTTVNYDHMTIQDMLKRTSPYLDEHSQTMLRNKAVQCYGGYTTHGRTIQEIRQTLIDAGYDPYTHTAISWFSVMDHWLLARIMKGDNNLIVPREDATHSLNVFFTCKNMLPQDFPSMRLAYVHQAVVPPSRRSVVKFHRADEDVRALDEIMKEMIRVQAAGRHESTS